MRNRIILFGYVLAAVLLLQSCSSDNGDDTAVSGGSKITNVQLTIAMSEAASGSRAGTWGDNDYQNEESTAWESAITTGKLQVLVFGTDNSYIGQVVNLIYTKASSSSSVYSVKGALNIKNTLLNNGKLSCKFVVVANYDDPVTLRGGDDMAAIESMGYRYNATAIATQTDYIPMWGVKTFTGDTALEIVEDGVTDAGQIDMLRAMAKIRVSLSDAMADDFAISAATVSDYNMQGYLLPAGYADVSETKALFYDGTTSPLSYHPRTLRAGSALSFKAETVGRTYVVYVPECATNSNSSTGNTDPYISVTIAPKGKPTESGTYTINLRQYISGVENTENLNLTRNTVYDYVITNVGPALTLKYQAIDWTAAENNVFFN